MPWWGYLGLAIAFATGVGIGLLLGRRERARMREVRLSVAEIARGNFGHRVLLAGEDDAARIAEGINAMLDSVQRDREVAMARDAAQRRLLANVSHDLRTPIASIAGYVDALQRGLGDDPERYLAIIGAKTEELAELTDDLFFEARLDAGDLELAPVRIDLAEAVRRSVLGFEPQLAARDIRVDVDIPEEACVVEADPSAVARIVGNLISNALRHARDMTALSVRLADAGRSYMLQFTNDGAEVPADMERLFERGVAGSGGGAGLGLSIARELAGRMGATIAAERGAASTVTFTVTFAKPAAD